MQNNISKKLVSKSIKDLLLKKGYPADYAKRYSKNLPVSILNLAYNELGIGFDFKRNQFFKES